MTGAAEIPQLAVRGPRVGLGALRRDLLPAYEAWANDPLVARERGLRDLYTPEAIEAWYRRFSEIGGSCVAFTIYELGDNAPIGTSELREISYRYGTAAFAISLGQKRGQGFGSEATRLTVDWGFSVLGLHNISVEARVENVAAIRAYQKAGFSVIGRRRRSSFARGRRTDEVLMDIVPEDLPESVLGVRDDADKRADEPPARDV